MKKREIEQLITQEMRNETPDILHRIDLDTIEIIEPSVPFYKRLLKPVLIPSFALTVLALLLIALFNLGSGTPPGTNPNQPPIVYSEREEAYTLSALSAISLLNQVNTENSLNRTYSLMVLSQSFTDSGPTLILDNHIEDLNRTLTMIEPLIGRKDAMQFTIVDSELEDYTYRVSFTNTDMRGQTIEYIMHYNETKDDEETFLLDGIMIIGSVTYHLEGELYVSDDEFELEIIARHPTNEDTYVAILQEITPDEHTFEYEVVRNGETLYESELTIEFDGDEITIEIEYESETLTYSFEIERRIVNSKPVYFIEYDIETLTHDEDGEITIEILYNTSEDAYYYRYMIESDDTQAIRYIKRVALVD